MYTHWRKLADLHTHFYGCIGAADFLEFLQGREVDWTAYRRQYLRVYGTAPPVEEIIERCRRGAPGARAEFERLFVFGDEDSGNFERFQAKYDMLVHGVDSIRYSGGQVSLPTLFDGIRAFIRETIARQRRENVGYIEQRMTLGSKYTPAQAKELVLAMLGTFAECEGPDMRPRLAISLPRDNPWPAWEVTQEVALGPLGRLLTGVDFCYFEEGHPPKEQRGMFDAARDFNGRHPERALAILYHVGESFGDKSLESAVRWVHEAAEMGAHRLGHAISLGVDPHRFGEHRRSESVGERIDQLNYDLRHREGLAKFGVNIDGEQVANELRSIGGCRPEQRFTIEYDEERLADVRRRQRYAIDGIRSLESVIEVCPTSNRRIGGIDQPEHHPVKQFISTGAPFVVATDDPGTFGITLADEMLWVMEHHHLPDDAMEQLVDLAWDSRSEVLSGRLSRARSIA